jgi:hypothetical protein
MNPDSPRDRLRYRVAALGVLATRPTGDTGESAAAPPAEQPVDMDRIAGLTAGWGAQLDDIIAEDRERS